MSQIIEPDDYIQKRTLILNRLSRVQTVACRVFFYPCKNIAAIIKKSLQLSRQTILQKFNSSASRN